MSVHGEAVVGVVLQAAPRRLPFGQDPHEQPVLVESLEGRYRPGSRRQETEEGLS